MATFFTIESDGTETSFRDMGFSDEAAMDLRSQGKSTFSVRIVGANPVSDPPIPFEAPVIIRRGRSLSGGVYGGGEIIFQGFQITDGRIARPDDESNVLVFGDAWYFLENLVFQQSWSYRSAPGVSSTTYFSRLILFQNADGTLKTNGDQIEEVIDYAASCGCPIQVGTIDPAFAMPVYPIRALMCSEVILLCLRPTPDAVTYFDYTTTPPTFHCKQRANLTGLDLPFADGTSHRSSDFVPRYDLQVPAVILQYQKSIQENNLAWTDFGSDVYPGGSTGQVPRSLVCPIDLRGAKRVDIDVRVTSATLDPTNLNFWKQKKPDLASSKYNSLALVGGSITIKDDAGATVSLSDFPYEYRGGEVLPWMEDGSSNPILAKQVTITGQFTYNERDTSSRTLHVIGSAAPHQISVRVRVTNSPPTDTVYSALETLDPGETAPEGLAQAIYESLQQLQYDGTHDIVEVDVSTIIGPKYALNLTGGATAWATARMTIQVAHIEFHSGRTTITVGPAKHIAPGDLQELLQWTRFRAIYDNPNLRHTGSESDERPQVGGDTSAENTSDGLKQPQVHTIAAPAATSGHAVFIQHDATSKQVLIQEVDSGGTRVDAAGFVAMWLGDLAGRGVRFRKVYFKDPYDSCAKKMMWALCSEPEADTDH